MEYMSNKALVIAVSLIISMSIASAVILVINQVMTVYKQVYETDTSIKSGFDEFDSYDNTTKTALEVLSTVKKYKDNSLVEIIVAGQGNNKDAIQSYIENSIINKNSIINEKNKPVDVANIDSVKASAEYSSKLERMGGNKIKITFTKK